MIDGSEVGSPEAMPLPDIARMASFWTAAAAGRLVFPRCTACGSFNWYPEALCRSCGADALDWSLAVAPPRVFTWTVIRRALEPRFAPFVPFASVIVEFADAPGVRLITRLIDAAPEDLRIGQLGRVVFRDLGYPTIQTGIVAPLFTIAG